MHRNSDGFTLIEMLFVVATIGLLSAMALPSLQRARIAANESAAMGSMRSISSGQQVFWSTCGYGMYSPSLQNLGISVGGAPGFVSPDLSGPAPVIKGGFEFDLSTNTPVANVSCNGGATAMGYHATADPLFGSGRRYLGTNATGTVFESPGTLFGIMPDTTNPPAPAVPIASR
jgi:prepilin-type N-terminal cleavage/methylation domain-containing protein